MKNKKIKIILTCGLVVFFISFVFCPSPDKVFASSINASILIDLTNEARANDNLPVLVINQKLIQAALAKGNDMIENNYFAHTSPSGITPWHWIDQTGYDYIYAGENLAIDFATSEDIFNAWMESPLHRENILNSHYKDIGISVVTGDWEGRNTTIVIQMFGSTYPPSPTATAPINSKLETKVNNKQETEQPNSYLLIDEQEISNLLNPQDTHEVYTYGTSDTSEIIVNSETLSKTSSSPGSFDSFNSPPSARIASLSTEELSEIDRITLSAKDTKSITPSYSLGQFELFSPFNSSDTSNNLAQKLNLFTRNLPDSLVVAFLFLGLILIFVNAVEIKSNS